MLWSVTGDDCERNRGAIYRLLHQAIKQQTTSFRFATIKPKGERAQSHFLGKTT